MNMLQILHELLYLPSVTQLSRQVLWSGGAISKEHSLKSCRLRQELKIKIKKSLSKV